MDNENKEIKKVGYKEDIEKKSKTYTEEICDTFFKEFRKETDRACGCWSSVQFRPPALAKS
ncbi:MAG: hypothetical protein AB1480_11550 [Nitrospirota bacterium]